MSDTIYLKDQSGIAQPYAVHKGIQLSNGVGGWISFINSNSIRVQRFVSPTQSLGIEYGQTQADFFAAIAMGSYSYSFALPSTATITNIDAVVWWDGLIWWRDQHSEFVISSWFDPNYSNNASGPFLSPIITTIIEDDTLKITAALAVNETNDLWSFLFPDEGGAASADAIYTLNTRMELIITYTE